MLINFVNAKFLKLLSFFFMLRIFCVNNLLLHSLCIMLRIRSVLTENIAYSKCHKCTVWLHFLEITEKKFTFIRKKER